MQCGESCQLYTASLDHHLSRGAGFDSHNLQTETYNNSHYQHYQLKKHQVLPTREADVLKYR